MALRIKEPKLGDWDYDASFRPDGKEYFNNRTFSVGIFQWIQKANGKGIKRSAVKKRIRGYSINPGDVYKRADDYIKSYLEKNDD